MELTQELFQKCRRITAAIQEFLIQTGMVNTRSTDVYDFLARKCKKIDKNISNLNGPSKSMT